MIGEFASLRANMCASIVRRPGPQILCLPLEVLSDTAVGG